MLEEGISKGSSPFHNSSEVPEDDNSDLDVLLDLLDDEGEVLEDNAKPSIPDNFNAEGVSSQVGLLISSPGPSNIKKNEEPNKVNDEIDPLEKELLLMEEKMNKLKKEICKKKNIKPSDDSSVSFTKISSVIDPNSKKNEVSKRFLNKSEKENLLKKIKSKESEIHLGDTDSEDDEDNRSPFEAKFGSYGKEMKKMLAQHDLDHRRKSPETKPSSSNAKISAEGGWNGVKGGGSLLAVGMNTKQDDKKKQHSTQDPFSGIRIVNPLVSFGAMKELMEGRRMIQMSSIVSHIRGGEIEGDWVTIGVIISKSETKKSQKGTQYSIWQMSDLKDCTKVVSLFLFAGAYKHLWKTTVGSVAGILNPQIMKDSNKPNDGRTCVTLSVNTNEKLLLMGTSKDLGWCKGKTKQGFSCRQFVNKNVCEFCIFHIQREYQKMSSKRSEIQSSFTRGGPRKSFQDKILGKNQVFYGGQLYTTSGPKEGPKKSTQGSKGKDLSTLSSLSLRKKADSLREKDSSILRHLSDDQFSTVKKVSEQNEELGQMLLAPTPGARNLILHKTKETCAPSKSPKSSPQRSLLSAKEFLKSSMANTKSKPTAPRTPQLGRGLSPGNVFEVELPSAAALDPAKARAASLIKSRGGLDSPERNMKRNKEKAASSDFRNSVRKRIREVMEKEDKDLDISSSETTEDTSNHQIFKKKSLLGSVDINSEEFRKIMGKKSNHSNLIQRAEDEEVEKYYNTLEKKEMLENKMASTMEMPVSAVVCLKCKYKASSASEHCREEGHPLKVIKASRRFFECRNCKQRKSSLEKLPTKPCSHCSRSSWKRVAMAREKQGPKLDSEILSMRGDELSNVSSSSNKIYLNL